MHLKLPFHPYRAQLTQQLKPANHSQRRRYVELVLEQKAVGGNFSNKIFITNKAHFTYVNKQNYRIWRSKNPQVIEQRPLHSEKGTVWCALWSEGVIEPHFSENDDGTTVTVNSER